MTHGFICWLCENEQQDDSVLCADCELIYNAAEGEPLQAMRLVLDERLADIEADDRRPDDWEADRE